MEHRQVNINSSSWCLQCPQNPEKGIFPFNPLWQDRWHLQPNLAPGKCFSCYQLRCVSSTVSITRTCRTTRTFARSIFHLITSLSIGASCYSSKRVAKEESESCIWAGNFLVHSGMSQEILFESAFRRDILMSRETERLTNLWRAKWSVSYRESMCVSTYLYKNSNSQFYGTIWFSKHFSHCCFISPIPLCRNYCSSLFTV